MTGTYDRINNLIHKAIDWDWETMTGNPALEIAAEIERLAPAETCSDSFCRWQTPSRAMFLVRDAAALEQGCVTNGIVVAQTETPTDYASRCQLAALITQDSIAQSGGATITETPLGPRIARAWTADIRRPWTPQTRNAEGE